MSGRGMPRWFSRPQPTPESVDTANAGRRDEAFAAAQRLVDAGNALEDRGDGGGALMRYREAVALAPTYPRAHLNLGNALRQQGDLDAAIAALRTALGLDPQFAPAHFNLGILHANLGDAAAAERALREALRLAPAMSDAAIALANLFESTGRLNEAEGQLRNALRINPRHGGAAHNLGLLLNKLGRWDEAEQAYEQALAAEPSSARALSALAFQYRQTGRLVEADRLCRQALAVDPKASEVRSGQLFMLNFRDDLDAAAIFREHENFSAAFEPPTVAGLGTGAGRLRGQARLRVAYLSGDFFLHPVGLFLRSTLKEHDRSCFEVYCYSNNDADDAVTRELKSSADVWRNIADRDDAAVAEMLRADGIGILVDLSGHTGRSRVLLFSRRCAPVQATWLGYLNTTGLRSADYRICDGNTDPPGMNEHLHSERLLRLPHSQWCYAPVSDLPVAPVPHGGDPERVIFGSFNQFPKISESCLDLWCEALRSVTGSELQVFSVPEGRTMSVLLAALERRGIDRGRVTLHPRLGVSQYFAALGEVDIALDTFPYNGATTALDTLWMGIPLVALVGDRSISRGTFSILNTLQLPELIASTKAEFVERNVHLAHAIRWRQELRQSLRTRMERSPLMDAAGFTRDLEDGYRRMWQAACSA